MRWNGEKLATLRSGLGATHERLASACQSRGVEVSVIDLRRWESRNGKGGPNGRSQAALVASLSEMAQAAGWPLVTDSDLYDGGL